MLTNAGFLSRSEKKRSASFGAIFRGKVEVSPADAQPKFLGYFPFIRCICNPLSAKVETHLGPIRLAEVSE